MSNLIQACRMQYPDTIPVDISILPAAWLKYGEELQRLVDDYPQFFGGMKKDLTKIIEQLPPSYRKGIFIDEWNCVWSNVCDGNEAIVTGHPLKCEEDVYALKIPDNRTGRLPHGFMYLRLLDLCGFEDAMIYFAEEGETIRVLIDKVLEYNLYQVAAILPHMADIVYFGDDLGNGQRMDDVGGAVLALLELVLGIGVVHSLVDQLHVGTGHIPLDGLYHAGIMFFIGFHRRISSLSCAEASAWFCFDSGRPCRLCGRAR